MPNTSVTPGRTVRVFAYALALACVVTMAAVGLTGCASPAPSPTPSPSAPIAPAPSSTDGVQRFSIDLSSGTYVPAEITAKAGVPVSITFGQGRGCVQELVFPAFGIDADLSQGPKTFDLGPLKAGDYPWACGMDMRHGVLKVR